jgi:hypothetical protein
VRLAILRAAKDIGALTARELVELAGVDRQAGMIAIQNLTRIGALVAVGSRRVPWRRAPAATYAIGAPSRWPASHTQPEIDPSHALGVFLRQAWQEDAR